MLPETLSDCTLRYQTIRGDLLGKTLYEFLEMLFGSCVFVVAALLLASQAYNVTQRQDVVASYAENAVALSRSYRWEQEQQTVSYKDLCTRMMRGVPCDIKIDGQLVEKQWYNSNTFDYGIIRAGHSYLVSYEYDADGGIKRIIYTSV